MAVNLATKYSPNVNMAFKLGSLVDGKTNKEYDFIGVRTLSVWTPTTQALNDYARTGANRYGTPTEMQDTLQEMTLTKDRSFSITIDKGNNTEQMNAKKSGAMLRAEIDERVIPEMDAYALSKFANTGGKITALSAAPAADTVVGMLKDGMVYLSNKKVPKQNRVIWIGWSWFGYLLISSQFLGIDKLGEKALANGALGMFMDAQVIPVPDDYLLNGTAQCYFTIAHEKAVMQPKKIQDYFIKQDPPGINGKECAA